MSGSGGQSPAEQHLGDRLAALVDGELGHDQRERVLAHLATCGKCKAEADAQRELKNVFAGMAPPGPSDGLLARLQGLPGGDPGAPAARLGEGGLGRGAFGRGGLDGGGFGRGGMSFTYAPSGAHAVPGLLQERAERGFPQRAERGFPVHGRAGARPAAAGAGAGAAPVGSPRRRFAFAAAGAVSLAAFALSGALPLEAAVDTASGRGEGASSPLTASSADASSAVGRERPGAARAPGDRDALLGVLQGRATPAAASAEFYPAAASLPVSYASPLADGGSSHLSPLIAPGPSGARTASGPGTDAGAVAGTSVGATHGLPGAGTGAGGGTEDSAGPSGGGPLPSALASPAAPATSYPAAPLPPLEPKRPLLTRSASAAP
ncbi:zf-HC2 domain-containing protein [Streptomyces sp. NPDC050315]|uniref:anti-sigma factor family protein n=1 Tax=Streptomyces sp. NPDC050315 TaxID=3155039 RepID=UPI00342E4F4A